MYKIRNLTNSPYDLIDADGNKVRLPARGEVTTSLHPLHEGLYRAIKYMELEPVAPEDTGGPDEELETWRSLYEAEKGEHPDGRWSVKRIQKELEL